MKCKGRLLFVLGGLFLLLAWGVAWSQVTERVSVNSVGGEANNASTVPSTSDDGRYVAFESQADNLVAGDGNGTADVFVHDRQTGTTTRVSLHTDGTEGNRPSSDPSISSDGRYVAFESDADTLVDGDTPFPFGFPDIFVRDRDADGNGTYDDPLGVSTVRVSVDSAGTEGDGPSFHPSISVNGRYVAFQSDADLVLPDNGSTDIWVHDRDADEDGIYDDEDGIYDPGEVSTVRVSVDSTGSQGDDHSYSPSMSGDGRYVAFESIATNLVPGGSDGSIHIFVHDRDADEDGNYDEAGFIGTVQVSIDSAGTEGDAGSGAPSISSDGRYVAFESSATNLVPGGSNGSIHIFVHDRDADEDGIYDDEDGTYDAGEVFTVQVSVDSAGTEGDADSHAPSISSDGRYVAFESDATNLVADDTNGSTDVFVHDLQTGETTRVSVDLAGVEGNGSSNFPSMSADGKSVTFQSDADNLVAGDANAAPDIFVDDLQSGAGEGDGNGNGSGGCFIATAAH